MVAPAEAPKAWRRWLVPLGLLLPWLCSLRHQWTGGDLLCPPAALLDFHATILQHTALRTALQPVWWDPAIHGGFPSYASGLGAPWYPGWLLFFLLPTAVAAWNVTLLLHLGAASALLAARCNRAGTSLPLTLCLLALAGGSLDAFHAAQVPAVILALPWVIWGYNAEVAQAQRPLAASLLHWALIAGITGLTGPAGMLVVLSIGTGIAWWRQRRAILGGLALGGALAAVQLLPWLMQPEVQDWRRLGQAVLCVLHPAALLPALALVERDQRWLRLAIVPVLAVIVIWFTTTPALLGLAAASIVLWWWQPTLRLLPLRASLVWCMPALLLLSGLAGPYTVSFPATFIRELAGDTRRLLPAQYHPTVLVLEPPSLEGWPVASYGRPMIPERIRQSPAWPLLWNLAPDPGLGAASVALPWTAHWHELLATASGLHLREGGSLQDLLATEYLAGSLGATVLVSPRGNQPFLGYRMVDAAHPGRLPAPLQDEEALRGTLEEEVIGQLAAPDAAPPPAQPQAFTQEPVQRRYFYQTRQHLPWMVLGFRTDSPAPVRSASWSEAIAEALHHLQMDTDYPYFTSPVEWQRYIVVADDRGTGVAPGALLLRDQGFTLTTPPQRRATPTGMELAIALPATDAHWLICRSALVRGWSATVNDVPVPLARADGVWMAVPLPPAEAVQVQLRYVVPGLIAGRWVSGIGLLIWLLIGVLHLARSGVLHEQAGAG